MRTHIHVHSGFRSIKGDVKDEGLRQDEGLLKVRSFQLPSLFSCPPPPSPATFNIYLERDVAVIPSGRGDKMNHLIASSAGRELTPGSGSPSLRGELIYESMRGERGKRGKGAGGS